MEPTVTALGLIIDEEQDPLRIYLCHNNADPAVNGKPGKPAGWGLPGGGKELHDRTPRHAVRREVLREVGFKTVLGKFFPKSRYGEVIRQFRPKINNTVYVFYLLKADSTETRILEFDESDAYGAFSLTRILMMPLAASRKRLNPEGIYFAHRERIFEALAKLGFDFKKIIPNLAELLAILDWEEVGEKIYYLLNDALADEAPAGQALTAPEPPAPPAARPDSDDGWRRWAEKNFS